MWFFDILKYKNCTTKELVCFLIRNCPVAGSQCLGAPTLLRTLFE